EGGDEALPVGALLGKHFPARLGDPIVAAASLPRLLDPPSLDPAAILHAVERRVQGRQREPDAAARSLLDQLADLVPVVAFVLDEREDDDLGAALLRFFDGASRGHAGPLYAGVLYVPLTARRPKRLAGASASVGSRGMANQDPALDLSQTQW